MSGVYPASPVIKSVDFGSRFYNVHSESKSGRKQVRHLGGQRWEFSVKYTMLNQTDFGPVDAFIMAQKGGAETFTIILPTISDKKGTASGTILANGAASIGDTAIVIDGVSGTLTAGDVITFSSHTKVYKITSDLTGNGTLNIQQPLVAAVANNEALTFDSVSFTVRLDPKKGVQKFKAMPGVFYEIDVNFIEAV